MISDIFASKHHFSTLLENKLLQQPMDALCSVDLGVEQKEHLLCFSKFGIYVNYDGERSRQSEIMWPSEVRPVAPWIKNYYYHKIYSLGSFAVTLLQKTSRQF